MDSIKDNEGNSRKLFIEEGFKETTGKELTIAKLRAKLGMDVTLIASAEGSKAKIYDAEENGNKVEYERVSEKAENVFNSVKSRIRDGKKQAGDIVIYMDRIKYNLDEIKGGTAKAFYYDRTKQIQNIYILNKAGSIIYERSR